MSTDPPSSSGTGANPDAAAAGALTLSEAQAAWICARLAVAPVIADAPIAPDVAAVARDGLIARGLADASGDVDAALAAVVARAAEPDLSVTLEHDGAGRIEWACGPRLAVEVRTPVPGVITFEPFRTPELLIAVARAAGLAKPAEASGTADATVTVVWRPDDIRVAKATTGWREIDGRRYRRDGAECDAAAILAEIRDAVPFRRPA